MRLFFLNFGAKYDQVFLLKALQISRRYGVAIFVGIIAGIISAFVKWGAEHPFPPRSPIDFFAAACKVDVTGLSQDQILSVCSRAFLNPPHVFFT